MNNQNLDPYGTAAQPKSPVHGDGVIRGAGEADPTQQGDQPRITVEAASERYRMRDGLKNLATALGRKVLSVVGLEVKHEPATIWELASKEQGASLDSTPVSPYYDGGVNSKAAESQRRFGLGRRS